MPIVKEWFRFAFSRLCCPAAGAVAVILLLAPALPVRAGQQGPGSPAEELFELGLERLMDIEVTSAAKKAQRWSDAAAAVFVISQDDIRRSGVTSIPDALRMVPGVEVARIDSNKWAISSRGFNDRLASKMLELFDGRTVYTPLFAGVFWDRQDTMLEDIERIEVIRGPGATVWGANAVNGVINIITKKAGDTLGGLVTAGGGTVERGFGAARYGVEIAEGASLRLYGKYFDRSDFELPAGGDGADGWHMARAGFRLDAEPSLHDQFTVQGDIHDAVLGETYADIPPATAAFNHRSPVFGGNVLGRWKRTFSEAADLHLQVYYDRTDQRFAVLSEQRDTWDIDFLNRFPLGSRQEVVWGLGYRFTRDKVVNTRFIELAPLREAFHSYSAFVQDDLTLVPERLRLSLGVKYEHNGYTGSEVQPGIRVLWTPESGGTYWGAVSRAVRTPSRGEHFFILDQGIIPAGSPANPGPLPVDLVMFGNSDLKAEEVIACEIGWRLKASDRLTMDIAAFYNVYDRLVYPRIGTPAIAADGSALIVQSRLENNTRGHTGGVELAADVQVMPDWRLHAAYTYLQMVIHTDDAAIAAGDVHGKNPHHQVSLRSAMNLRRDVELDLWLRYVDRLPAIQVPGYLTADVRLAWKPLRTLELSLVGQNLFHDRRVEFVPVVVNTLPTAVGRSMYGKVTWKF